jgi:proline dehydrogenase
MVDFSRLRLRAPRREDLAGALERVPAAQGAVSPFVAGDSVASAVEVVGQIMSRGLAASVIYLPLPDSLGTARIADMQVISALADDDLADGTDLTLDLRALGLGRTSARALATDAAAVCAAAAAVGMTVTLSGLGHDQVEAALEVRAALAEEFPDLGVTLGANLLRTESDCIDLAAAGARVRLVKRDAPEGAAVAFTRAHDIDKSYVRCLRVLLAGTTTTTVATHDQRLIEIAEALSARSDSEPGHCTFQFRLGLLDDRAAELVATGATVSILVPFGPDWPTYAATRIALTPAAVGQAVRAAAGNGASR